MDEILFTTLLVFTLGSSLHFLHELPHKGVHNPLDVVSSVNESTWEHMKLLIVAELIFTISMVAFFPEMFGEFVVASFVGMAVSVLLMPLIYYSYRRILGKNIFYLDISLFFLCSFIFAIIFFYISTGPTILPAIIFTCLALWLLTLILTFKWTYDPPRNELFRCPVNDSYGHRK